MPGPQKRPSKQPRRKRQSVDMGAAHHDASGHAPGRRTITAKTYDHRSPVTLEQGMDKSELSRRERLSPLLRLYATHDEQQSAFDLISSWEMTIGKLLTLEEVLQSHGVSSKDAELVELPTSTGIPLYPQFQFDSGRVLPGIVDAFREIASHLGAWSVASYLMTPQPELDGLCPVQWLRERRDRGHLQHVLRAYRALLSQ